MFNMPNYKEFYQSALIPMVEKDRENFCHQFCDDCNHCIKANHWLVALEGSSAANQSGKYEWNIVVYPAKDTGVFWALKIPFYKSATPTSFSEAYEESKIIIQKIKKSELTAEIMAS